MDLCFQAVLLGLPDVTELGKCALGLDVPLCLSVLADKAAQTSEVLNSSGSPFIKAALVLY